MRLLFAFLFLLSLASLPATAFSPQEAISSAVTVHTARPDNTIGQCSGVYIGGGNILTSAHCFPRRFTHPVNLRSDVEFQGRRISGRLAFTQWNLDLAIIRIDASLPRAAAPRCEMAPRLDERVMTVGNPNGRGMTVTRGRITNPAVYGLNINAVMYDGVNSPAVAFSSSASIRGMSGGGVFDTHGRLIGLQAGSLGGGMSFLIRITDVCPVLQQNGIPVS